MKNTFTGSKTNREVDSIKKDDRVGVIVGRFQIDQLHQGHKALLQYVAERHDSMLVLVGVRPAEASDKNPLDYESRRVMIREELTNFPGAIISPIRDNRNDQSWSTVVDGLIQDIFGYDADVIFHVGRDSFSSRYSGQYEIEEHTFGCDGVEAFNIRQKIRNQKLPNADARLGAIHAIMKRSPITTTMVDMFFIREGANGGYELLVGKKAGEDKWRLPGGHVDPGESFEAAAAREMYEETGMVTSGGSADWKYIGNYEVPDWRVRDTDQIKYRTVLFTAEYFSGKAEAQSDLVEVKWLPLTADFNNEVIVPEHRRIVTVGFAHVVHNPPYFITNKIQSKINVGQF